MNEAIFTGRETTAVMPSGRVITFREPNGDDEEILSNSTYSKDNTNLINYAASLITKDSSIPHKPLVSDIMKWHANDIYYFMLQQRIAAHGNILKYKHVCVNDKCEIHNKEQDYEYTLDDFLLPAKDKEPTKDQARVYPLGMNTMANFILSSEKSLRFKILTVELEKNILAIPEAAYTKGTPLIVRELEINKGGEKWELVKYFGVFSAKEMAEIRGHLKKTDPKFDPQLMFDCPKCRTPYIMPLFSTPAFFYPEEGM